MSRDLAASPALALVLARFLSIEMLLVTIHFQIRQNIIDHFPR